MLTALFALALTVNGMATATLPGGITVTSGTPQTLATAFGTTSQQGMVRFGPWTFGTDQYFVINDEGAQSGNNTFFINKTTDGGATWTAFGDGGATPPWFVGQIFQVTKSGNFLYVLTNDLDRFPGNYFLHKFDTTSGIMTRTDTGIAVDATVENGENDVNTYAGLATLPSGDLVFTFPSAPETVGGHVYYRASWAQFNGATWSAPAPLPGQTGNARSYGFYAITVNPDTTWRAWAVSTDHFVGSGNPGNFWLHQARNSGAFGALQTISTDLNINVGNWFVYGPSFLPLTYTDASGTQRLVIPYIGGSATTGPPAAGIYSPGPALQNFVAIAADSGDAPAFSTPSFDSTTQMWGAQLTLESLAIPIYQNGVLMMLWASPTSFDAVFGASAGKAYWAFSLDNGATWTAATAFLTYNAPLVPSGLSPADDGKSAVLYLVNNPGPSQFNFTTQHFYFSLGVARAVIVPPGSGGRKPIVLTPNQFDFCLHREYRLFCNIDYNAKGCARLPKCFTVDEREWGEAG